MKILLLFLTLSFSFSSQAEVTDDFPSARVFYRNAMKKKKGSYIGTVIFSTVTPVFGWTFAGMLCCNHPYVGAKVRYFLYKSAYILKNTEEFNAEQLKKAQKRLSEFLVRLKRRVLYLENRLYTNHNKVTENEHTLFQRVSKWTVDDFAKLLNEADECNPGYKKGESYYRLIRDCYLSKFIKDLLTVSGDPDKSLFELAVAKERKAMGLE